MPQAIPYIALALTAAGTTASIVQSNNASDAAKEASDKQLNQQNDLAKKAQQQQSDAKTQLDANATRDNARMIQQSNALQGQGRSGTILTSPLGVTQGAESAKKTILGS